MLLLRIVRVLFPGRERQYGSLVADLFLQQLNTKLHKWGLQLSLRKPFPICRCGPSRRVQTLYHSLSLTLSQLYCCMQLHRISNSCNINTILSIDSDAEVVITSLQHYGPSLRYARNSGFHFRHKAVYWSNSFEYAVMWCFFRSNGYWPQDWSQIEDFRCLIFVARLSKEEFNGLGKINVVPPPRDKRGEEEFEKVGRMRVDESMISNARASSRT